MDVSWSAKVADLSKIGERDGLKSRKGDEPHWQRLRHGCYVGFRPSKRGGRGTWFARAYDPDTCKYSRKALGDYGSFVGHEIFSQARKDAERFADTVQSGGLLVEKLETVADACRAYAKDKPPAAEGILKRTVAFLSQSADTKDECYDVVKEAYGATRAALESWPSQAIAKLGADAKRRIERAASKGAGDFRFETVEEAWSALRNDGDAYLRETGFANPENRKLNFPPISLSQFSENFEQS